MTEYEGETAPLKIIWPERISCAAIDAIDGGYLGIVRVEAGGDAINLAIQPKDARILTSALMNLVDVLDQAEQVRAEAAR